MNGQLPAASVLSELRFRPHKFSDRTQDEDTAALSTADNNEMRVL
jgi:hypothetical protein